MPVPRLRICCRWGSLRAPGVCGQLGSKGWGSWGRGRGDGERDDEDDGEGDERRGHKQLAPSTLMASPPGRLGCPSVCPRAAPASAPAAAVRQRARGPRVTRPFFLFEREKASVGNRRGERNEILRHDGKQPENFIFSSAFRKRKELQLPSSLSQAFFAPPAMASLFVAGAGRDTASSLFGMAPLLCAMRAPLADAMRGSHLHRRRAAPPKTALVPVAAAAANKNPSSSSGDSSGRAAAAAAQRATTSEQKPPLAAAPHHRHLAHVPEAAEALVATLKGAGAAAGAAAATLRLRLDGGASKPNQPAAARPQVPPPQGHPGAARGPAPPRRGGAQAATRPQRGPPSLSATSTARSRSLRIRRYYWSTGTT